MAPGCFSSMAAATRAVVVDPETGLALVIDEEAPVGVPVEGQADVRALSPGSARCSATRFSG